MPTAAAAPTAITSGTENSSHTAKVVRPPATAIDPALRIASTLPLSFSFSFTLPPACPKDRLYLCWIAVAISIVNVSPGDS